MATKWDEFLKDKLTKTGLFGKKQNSKDFLELQRKLGELGYRTRDLS